MATLNLFSSMAVFVLCIMKLAMGAINKLKVSNLLGNISAASLISKYFGICASGVSAMTSHQSRFSIAFSKPSTHYITDLVPLCTF